MKFPFDSFLLAFVMLVATFLTGCGGSGDPSAADSGSNNAVPPSGSDDSDTLKTVAKSDLPPLSHYLPTELDDGRVRIAPPEGWHVASRSKEYLVRFVAEKNEEVPRIMVTAEDGTFDDFQHVDKDNVKEFAARVSAQLEEEEIKLIESVRPMLIGDHAFARYVRGARLGNARVEVQVLTTITNNRVYDVELTAYKRTVEKEHPLVVHRNDAYAVAAGLEFVGGEGSVPEASASSNESEPQSNETEPDNE